MKKITLLIYCFTFLFVMKGKGGTTYTLDVVVYGNPSNGTELNETGYSINGAVQEYNLCTATPSIHIAIIDSITCNPVNNCNRDFGHANLFIDMDGDCVHDISTITTCYRTRPENYFIYRDNDETAIRRMAQLLDSVEDGHIIIAYSAYTYPYSSMDTSFKNVFQRLGSTLIPSLPDSLPFIFVCRKGDGGSIHETVGALPNSLISVNMTYQCSPTGIPGLESRTFHLYPNPVEDKLHIDLQDWNSSEGEIKIYDAVGDLVHTQKLEAENQIINTEGFSAGIYIITIESSNQSYSLRFCKTK